MTPCSTLEQRWSACREQPSQVFWTVMQLWPFFGPANRPCTSPRRHHCRAGLSEHGYWDRSGWWMQQRYAGRKGHPLLHYDRCEEKW